MPHIAIIYDGIENSVFAGQVLAPLLKADSDHKVLISFESKTFSHQEVQKIIPPDARIEVYILKKITFIGAPTLWYATYQLKRMLARYDAYTLIARGPIAGLICARALCIERCKDFTIQARGLLGQEYRYAHAHETGFKKLMHDLRANQFEQLERECYGSIVDRIAQIPIIIEAVSPALGDYLVTQFDTPRIMIRVAETDKPRVIAPAYRLAMRMQKRDLLKIDIDAPVFCYNGSAKAWQCPEETIQFFKYTILPNQRNAVLLLLTQDIDIFEKLLRQYALTSTQYRLLFVPHCQVVDYLCAADVGLLFRENHIVNWVSRPTKALEYQAAALKIVHNNTVDYLIKNSEV